jgi:hypothetical protein
VTVVAMAGALGITEWRKQYSTSPRSTVAAVTGYGPGNSGLPETIGNTTVTRRK